MPVPVRLHYDPVEYLSRLESGDVETAVAERLYSLADEQRRHLAALEGKIYPRQRNIVKSGKAVQQMVDRLSDNAPRSEARRLVEREMYAPLPGTKNQRIDPAVAAEHLYYRPLKQMEKSRRALRARSLNGSPPAKSEAERKREREFRSIVKPLYDDAKTFLSNEAMVPRSTSRPSRSSPEERLEHLDRLAKPRVVTEKHVSVWKKGDFLPYTKYRSASGNTSVSPRRGVVTTQ